MRGKIQMAVLCGVAVICFCQTAFADEFGDKIAGALCSHDPGNFGVIITEDELKVWNQAHEGIFSGLTSEYTFKKNAGADSASCFAQRKVPPGGNFVADVTRTGRSVRMGSYRAQ